MTVSLPSARNQGDIFHLFVLTESFTGASEKGDLEKGTLSSDLKVIQTFLLNILLVGSPSSDPRGR